MEIIMAREEMMIAPELSEDLKERWIKYTDVSAKSREAYEKAIKQFFIYLADNGIRSPEKDDIRMYRDLLKLNHKPTTVQLYITAVKLFFRWTAEENIYPNIAEKVKGAKIDTAEHKREYLTTDQVKKLLNSIPRNTVKGKRDYAMILTMITTGLRTISIINANIGDLGMKNNQGILYYQGKGHEEKAVFVKLPEETEKAIREYLVARKETDPKAPLFSSLAIRNTGERMTTRSISRVVKDRLIEIGIDDERYTAHSLRHTFGTLSYQAGADPTEIQLDMDHKSINTTLIYTHISDREKTTCGSRIAGAIFG